MFYNFTADLKVGEQYQNYIIEKFTVAGFHCAPNPFTDYERMKAFDLYLDDKLVECKFDADSLRYQNLCLETDLLISAADLYIFGLPTKTGHYDHCFSRADIWRIIPRYYSQRKWIGSPKVEVVCPRRWNTTQEFGMSLEQLINTL